jgi:FlaA1/EpsC-like NDP-sugar epimerase
MFRPLRKVLQNIDRFLHRQERMLYQNRLYYQLSLKWLQLIATDFSLTETLLKRGYEKIIIYGAGPIGVTLAKFLEKDEKITVLAFLDQNPNSLKIDGIPVVKLGDYAKTAEPVLIIVTPIHSFSKIVESLHDKQLKNIVSLDEIFEWSTQ